MKEEKENKKKRIFKKYKKKKEQTTSRSKQYKLPKQSSTTQATSISLEREKCKRRDYKQMTNGHTPLNTFSFFSHVEGELRAKKYNAVHRYEYRLSDSVAEARGA